MIIRWLGGGYNSVASTGEHKGYFGPRKTGRCDKTDLTGFPWGKVIKADVFSYVQFPEHYWFEDSVMRQIVYERIDSAYCIDVPVYSYRTNPASITHSYGGNPKAIDSLYVTMALFKDRVRLGIPVDEEYVTYLKHMACLTKGRCVKLDKSIQRDIFVVYANWIAHVADGFALTDRVGKMLNTGDFGQFSCFKC